MLRNSVEVIEAVSPALRHLHLAAVTFGAIGPSAKLWPPSRAAVAPAMARPSRSPVGEDRVSVGGIEAGPSRAAGESQSEAGR